MQPRTLSPRILAIVGLLAMLVGAIDPLEGAFIILPGSGLATLGAWLGKSRHRMLLGSAFLLIALGVGAMVVLSMFGGVGGHTGRSTWWLAVVLPYPVGWLMGVSGGVLSLFETRLPKCTPQTGHPKELMTPRK